jgi:hypothetical protein
VISNLSPEETSFGEGETPLPPEIWEAVNSLWIAARLSVLAETAELQREAARLSGDMLANVGRLIVFHARKLKP